LGITPPELATLPVILGETGTKKLSKRDGAKDVLDYRAEGYLPEALVNFLALLGWHPEDETEVMDIEELITKFDISRLQKAGARFDEAKLLWMNHEHLKRLSDDEFFGRLTINADERNVAMPTYAARALSLLRERAQTIGDAVDMLASGEFGWFEEATPSRETLLAGAKAEADAVRTHLAKLIDIADAIPESAWGAESVKDQVFPYATEAGRSAVLWPMRVALSGREKSPDPFTLAGLLGKELVKQRLAHALELL
ncbi:MAG TPA: glutamate--tRNA ligase family protein, partial [Candidatus Paceibacterota bacterium]